MIIEVTRACVLTVKGFVDRHIAPNQFVRSDAAGRARECGSDPASCARVTPPAKAGEWLPGLHVVISNLKAFLLRTFLGVSPAYL